DVRLLLAYVQRERSGEWEPSGHHRSTGAADTSADMTREEALAILGLGDGATADEVVQAHRRLIAKMHPDKGGSDYLASRINLAKDTLRQL
ncbi:MAG: molecular chaperone DnaJ, partial [Pseudomonadota bacterium]